VNLSEDVVHIRPFARRTVFLLCGIPGDSLQACVVVVVALEVGRPPPFRPSWHRLTTGMRRGRNDAWEDKGALHVNRRLGRDVQL